MLALLVELRHVVYLVNLTVNLEPLEAAPHQLCDLLTVLALAPTHRGRQQIQSRAVSHGHDAVDHLAYALALDGQTGGWRIGDADSRPEQAHVVVDLSHRAHCGARVARGRLLVDSDGRRQAVDRINIRLFHQLKELSSIGRQALDIAPLAFGIDSVEGERGFARAREARDHDERVARQIYVNGFEVMLAGAAYGYVSVHGQTEV